MVHTPRHWLVKSEPKTFSWDDLLNSKDQRTCWDGIRNYQVRNFIRDEIKCGDQLFFYHSNAKPPGIIGIAEVVEESYPDPTQFDPSDGHFDAKSQSDAPRWLMFDLVAKRALASFVSLEQLKQNPRLSSMLVVQRGQRLSIQPVTAAEWREVLAMAAGGQDAP